MQEPLLWNPLPDAAAWLADKTGRTIDARALLDIVASRGKEGDPTPTIIKALLPREAKFALVAMPGHRALSEVESLFHDRYTKEYGPLPRGFSYVGAAYPIAEPLCVNFLMDLLLYGHTEIALIANGCDKGPHEDVWLMPFSTSHRVTLETCGINRADLMTLADTLTAPVQADDDAGSGRTSKKTDPWMEEALEMADNIWLHEFERRGRAMKKRELSAAIASRLKSYRTVTGKEVLAGYVYDNVLKGDKWNEPKIEE